MQGDRILDRRSGDSVLTSALDHKALDHTVNDTVLVVQRSLGDRRETLFSCAKCAEAA